MTVGEEDAGEGNAIAENYEHQDPCCEFEIFGRKDACVKQENREFTGDRCEKPCEAGA